MRGNIRRRGVDKWELRVYLGRDPVTGRPQQKSETFHGSRRDADRRLRDLIDEREKGRLKVVRAQLATFAELFERRLTNDPNLAPSTARAYRSYYRTRIGPVLGKRSVRSITTSELNDFYTHLRSEGLARGSVQQIHAIISSTLEFGVSERFGGLTTNEARGAKGGGKIVRPAIEAPRPEDVLRLLDPVNHDEPAFLLACRLAAATGARRGEIVGLRWSDLDEDGRLWIRRSIHNMGYGVMFVKLPKTARGRSLYLDDDTFEMLREIRFDPDLRPDDYMTSGNVEPRSPDWITRQWGILCARVGIEGVRFHDLRHFHATYLLAGKMGVNDVSGRLGHANPSTTLNVYGHAVRERDREAARIIGQLLWNKPTDGS